MDVISIDTAADILDLHKSRVEQWISRGQFKPRAFSSQGQKRGWDQAEVIRLGVFAQLVDGFSMQPMGANRLTANENRDLVAELAGRLTQYGVHGFVDDGAFFVCYQTTPGFGWSSDIVRKREVGAFLTNGCEMPKILMEGRSEEAIRYNSEKELGPASLAITVDLDRIERIVLEGWPKAPKAD
ncbi:hypothetical protein CO662_32935 [Rhizobium anhuiense]|uniref:Helix-turn-helix domain-containing protein n=1 Tax=Rhizobium anhuiense TaxID=1184720 RepID=A0ABX4J0T9_9HYPH|nr:hypothetical protein [Rhizobium anhuiense]PDS43437.1 hypothetical protein CO668_18740 [Rhizobium anhuiense]PDS47748.1 hypothetical protein CO662_32935 [Rhizobium anhuiense]